MNDFPPAPSGDQITIGMSACLAGEEVRFDGGHCRNRLVHSLLGGHARFVTVCPEVEAGLGTPRPVLRLSRLGDRTRVIERQSGVDRSPELARAADRLIDQLDLRTLCGFVVKSRSPSCGMERVRVYDDNGIPSKSGVGIFAARLAQRLPWLPIEEEGRLNDPLLRESFLEAVFGLARWRTLQRQGLSAKGLLDHHARAKYQLMSHDPARSRGLGRVGAAVSQTGLDRAAMEYEHLYMQCLKQRTSRRKHTHTLERMAAPLRDRVSPSSRRELQVAIGDYREGRLPRSVPAALIRHHAREHQVPYLCEQTYFEPFPKQLLAA